MKPWYWPVTSTVYKLVLGFVLATGCYWTLEYFGVPHGWVRGALTGASAYLIYFSLWKRDWL